MSDETAPTAPTAPPAPTLRQVAAAFVGHIGAAVGELEASTDSASEAELLFFLDAADSALQRAIAKARAGQDVKTDGGAPTTS